MLANVQTLSSDCCYECHLLRQQEGASIVFLAIAEAALCVLIGLLSLLLVADLA